MEQKERRGSRRLKLSWPIWVLRNERELARGKTENISRSGAYFQSSIPSDIQPGMTVSVRIGIPGAGGGVGALHTLTGEARVVRLEPDDEGCGVALHFSEELDPFSDAKQDAV